jgi:hypothetical protein
MSQPPFDSLGLTRGLMTRAAERPEAERRARSTAVELSPLAVIRWDFPAAAQPQGVISGISYHHHTDRRY